MDALAVLRGLEAAGVVVRVVGAGLEGGPFTAITPEIRGTIRQHKAELIALLRAPVDLCDLAPSALRLGSLVTCKRCRHCEPRPGQRPDGWCGRHSVETWVRVPFGCDHHGGGRRS